MADSLQQRMNAVVEEAPERRIMGFMDSRGETEWWSALQFHARAASYAAWLREAGVGARDICVIVLPSGERCASVLAAVLQMGAVPLLVAPPFLQGHNSSLSRILAHTVRVTGARVVIGDSSLEREWETSDAAAGSTTFLAIPAEEALLRFSGDGPGFQRPSIATPAATDVAALQLTSGTTGLPRICVWTQKQVLAALDAMKRAMVIEPDDICFNWTPLYHDMGLVNNFLLCLTSGIPIVLLSPQDFVRRPALWLNGLSRVGATITWSPNFGFSLAARRVRDDEMACVRLDHVRAFWNASERIHLETMELFFDRFACFGLTERALKTNFGCAENIGGATFSDPQDHYVVETVDRSALFEKQRAVPANRVSGENSVAVVGVGRPVPGTSIHIISPAGDELEDGMVGEIALRTPSRMTCYLKDEDATRRAMRGDLLLTGDLGYLRNGELFWVGRVKERITIRGKKLDPSDFEASLLEIDGLRPGCFVAFGVDDSVQGTQRVVILAERRDGASPPDDELVDQVRDRISIDLGVEVEEVVIMPKGTLSKTSSGKRRHTHFRELYQKGGGLSTAAGDVVFSARGEQPRTIIASS